ncbi:MAG: tRNA (adenosine(37)-N6)-dimethylallyltransferase MiaA [Chitinophagales bacterium]
MSPKIYAISGPTAVGKTTAAISLAKKLGGEIISFDSRQVYKELNIGVARPSIQELSEVKHHLIAYKSIHDAYSVGEYLEDFKQVLSTISSQNVILCGGTGLYLKAIEYGLDNLPKIDPKIRLEFEQELETKGIDHIQKLAEKIDPKAYQNIDIQNPRRLQRIIETYRQSGLIYSDILTNDESKKYTIKHLVLDIPRNVLYQKIEARVDQMILDGQESEAESLYPFRHLQALQTVGYSELFDFIDGKYSKEYAIDKIKQHTRNYAKRQMTWNRSNIADAQWINPIENKSWIDDML